MVAQRGRRAKEQILEGEEIPPFAGNFRKEKGGLPASLPHFSGTASRFRLTEKAETRTFGVCPWHMLLMWFPRLFSLLLFGSSVHRKGLFPPMPKEPAEKRRRLCLPPAAENLRLVIEGIIVEIQQTAEFA